jgi:hypothetical protein
MDGGGGHAPTETARAEAALLAGQGHDLGVAAAAAHEMKAALRPPHLLAEGCPALGHRLVERGFFWPAAGVASPMR